MIANDLLKSHSAIAEQLQDAIVLFLDGVVEEAARGGDLVLEVGKILWSRYGVRLEVGMDSDSSNSWRSAPVSMFSAAPWAAGPWAAMAELRALTTASSVPLSCAA